MAVVRQIDKQNLQVFRPLSLIHYTICLRRCVVYQHIYPAELPDDGGGKGFQSSLVRAVSHEVVTLHTIDDADLGPLLSEFLGSAKTDAVSTAGDDDYFIPEYKESSLTSSNC